MKSAATPSQRVSFSAPIVKSQAAIQEFRDVEPGFAKTIYSLSVGSLDACGMMVSGVMRSNPIARQTTSVERCCCCRQWPAGRRGRRRCLHRIRPGFIR
jgi:hypothetical protein